MKIFEKATKLKLRFSTPRGKWDVEGVWDMPLNSKGDGFSLDELAISLDKEIKEKTGVSFVNKKDVINETAMLKLDVVKHIIAVRLEEIDEKEKALINKTKIERIDEAIEEAEGESLKKMSKEELLEMKNSLID